MTLPALLLGVIISSLIGTLFHLWKGGSPIMLALYLVSSWSGFWLGHLLGNQLSWTFFDVGPLHLGMALIGSVLVIFFGHWLSLVQVQKIKHK